MRQPHNVLERDWRTYMSLAGLIGLVTLADPNGGMLDLPLSFILKNELQLDAAATARFRLLAAIPLCLAIVFGVARDRLAAAAISDRALLIGFGLLGASVCSLSALGPVTPASLLVPTLLATCLYQMLVAAQSGLVAQVARRTASPGPLSAAWNAVVASAAALASATGGVLSQALLGIGPEAAAHTLFLVLGALMALTAAYAALDAAAVLSDTAKAREASVGKSGADQVRSTLGDSLKELAHHRAIYAPLAIWLLWNLAPGSATPLQYDLQDRLGATNAQWGQWNALFNAAFVPMYLAYGWLSSRVRFTSLLRTATLLALLQYLPLLFVRTLEDAMIAAVVVGLLGGLASAAYLDLLLRACPPGLEGTTMMAAGSLYYIAIRAGDVLGAWIYATPGGLAAGLAVSTLLTATILLILPRIRHLGLTDKQT